MKTVLYTKAHYVNHKVVSTKYNLHSVAVITSFEYAEYITILWGALQYITLAYNNTKKGFFNPWNYFLAVYKTTSSSFNFS